MQDKTKENKPERVPRYVNLSVKLENSWGQDSRQDADNEELYSLRFVV